MRPIDADALMIHIKDIPTWCENMESPHPTKYPAGMFDPEDIISAIDEAPTLDVAPMVHGRWYVCEYEYLNCSVCGDAMYTGCNSTKEAKLLKDHWKKYCPNCGAKMDKEDDTDD